MAGHTALHTVNEVPGKPTCNTGRLMIYASRWLYILYVASYFTMTETVQYRVGPLMAKANAPLDGRAAASAQWPVWTQLR